MKAAMLDPQTNSGPPRKLFYRIQEVAKMTGLKPYVLRYWESEFKDLAPAKDASDQRRYRQVDIEVILAIRKLLYEDRFTIQGARKRLRGELQKMRGGTPEFDIVAELPIPSAAPRSVAAPEPPDRALNTTLRRLRMEVNDLINMLSH